MTRLEDRFRILVCIDGSDESYRGLRYAVKMAQSDDTDIVLLYVRALDQGLRSGGLQVRVARENMLNWGLELPGIKYLKKGRDLLFELGFMEEGWREKNVHLDAYNDPLGDNKIEYHATDGRMVVLKLKVAPNITLGILDQFELAPYDLIIIGASESWRSGRPKAFWDPAVAEEIAATVPCSIIVSRELEAGHGHLICVDGSHEALETALIDAELAARCDCPVTLLSVALTEDERPKAEKIVEAARNAIEYLGIDVVESLVRVGDPADEIIEAGPDYSLIVISESKKSGLASLFSDSVPDRVLKNAFNSVAIIR